MRHVALCAACLLANGSIFWAMPGQTQLIPDQTLGVEHSVVTPDSLVRGEPADLVEGGAVRGANLFHSFSAFNVDPGQRVYFANPAAVESILSRVTGNDVSDILGTLGVDGHQPQWPCGWARCQFGH